jgi:hypothetical protein
MVKSSRERLAKPFASAGESALESLFSEFAAGGKLAHGPAVKVLFLEQSPVVVRKGRQALVKHRQRIALLWRNVRRLGLVEPAPQKPAARLTPPPLINKRAAGETREPPPEFVHVGGWRHVVHGAQKREVCRFGSRLFIAVGHGQRPAKESWIKHFVKFTPCVLVAAAERYAKGTQVAVHRRGGQ